MVLKSLPRTGILLHILPRTGILQGKKKQMVATTNKQFAREINDQQKNE